jgi:DNA repair protein RecO (recombination protein O)
LPSVRTHCLVLRSVEVFETSSVLTLFTRELGKVSALAKGARRLKSPFQSALDLLCLCDIVLLHKASEALDLLTEAELLECFDAIRRDLSAIYAGYYISELLNELTHHHDPHPRLSSPCGTWTTRCSGPDESSASSSPASESSA